MSNIHNEAFNYLNNLSNMAVVFKTEWDEEEIFSGFKLVFINETLNREIQKYENNDITGDRLAELFKQIFERCYKALIQNKVYKDYLMFNEKIYEAFLCNTKDGFVVCNIYEISEALENCEDVGFYKNVIGNAMDIILFVGEDGRILYGNKKAVDTYGYSFEELLKLSIFDIRNHNKKEYAKHQLYEALDRGIKFETYHYKKDGSRFPVEVNSIHVSQNAKNVVMSIVRDISQRERIDNAAIIFSASLNIFEEAVIVVNKNNVITHWSKGAENKLGYIPEEIVGKRLDVLIPECKMKENIELCHRVYNGAIIENFETIRTHKNNNIIDVSISISSICDQDGEYNGLIAVYKDISEKKRLIRQLHEYEVRCRNALDGGQFGLWDINTLTNEVYYSKRWKEILGYNEDELENNIKEWQERVHPEDIEAVNNIFKNITNSEEITTECRVRCKDGKYRWIRSKGRIVEWTEQGEPLRIIGTNEDIDNRKYYEKNLEEKNKQLERLKQEADNANREKSLFLANVSHEIRTPLHGIIGTLQLLQRTVLNDEQNRHTTRLMESAEVLMELINDLLDISKIESGNFKLKHRAFDLINTVKSIFNNLLVSGNAKGLEIGFYLDKTITPNVIGDELRIRQILTNILDNAVKFTDEGYISFGVRKLSSQEDYQEIEFKIKDSGIGIEEDLKEKIFDDFVQGDLSASKKYVGCGLGLSICKQLAGIMDGDLRFESQVGKGTTFYFTCKFMKDNALSFNPSIKETKVVNSNKNKNILCVEDNIISLDIIEGIVEIGGYNCFSAQDGQKALEIVRENSIDLVLMDLQMPRMNGIEITKAIRENETGDRHIPIIAITAYAKNGDRDRCLSLGMDDYISKPFDIENLYIAIEKHIKK